MSRVIAGSANQVNLLNIGNAIPLSMAMVNTSMATSLSLVMMNATTAQKHAQAVENASVTQCCALMISAGAAAASK